jgi:hypothetical protein
VFVECGERGTTEQDAQITGGHRSYERPRRTTSRFLSPEIWCSGLWGATAVLRRIVPEPTRSHLLLKQESSLVTTLLLAFGAAQRSRQPMAWNSNSMSSFCVTNSRVTLAHALVLCFFSIVHDFSSICCHTDAFVIPKALTVTRSSGAVTGDNDVLISPQRRRNTVICHGIPKMFRWLTDQYPNINRRLSEGLTQNTVVDNFYLDCNGLIHPATHNNSDEFIVLDEKAMFKKIFSYVDRCVFFVIFLYLIF